MESQNSGSSNLPEKKFRAGPISATIWKNAGTNQKGEPTEYRTISFERSYKDKSDNWQKTNSLRLSDVPRAVLVLEKAYEYIALSGEEAEAF